MNMITRSCGWLVALICLGCSAFGLYYVYLLLTFNFIFTKTVAQNFRDYRLSVISWTLASLAFIAGAFGILLRRSWARGISFFLCALGVFYAACQIIIRNAFELQLPPIGIAGVVCVSILISAWLASTSGRTYFQRAGQLG